MVITLLENNDNSTVLYNSFNELPDEYRMKFKGGSRSQAKEAYVRLVNTLIARHNTLLSDYANGGTKILVDYGCGHEPKWIRPDAYKSGQGCMECFRSEQRLKLKEYHENMTSEEKEAYREKCRKVNGAEWERRRRDEKFMYDFRCSIKNGMENMSCSDKQKRKEAISSTWENKTEEERRQFHIEHSGENSSNWKGGPDSIDAYLRQAVCTKEWKKETIKNNNYKCCLTDGGKRLNIHHIRSFNLLVVDAHEALRIKYKKESKNYTNEEKNALVDYIAEWHKNDSNYVVISEEVHMEFHRRYGFGYNTAEQWNEFVKQIDKELEVK